MAFTVSPGSSARASPFKVTVRFAVMGSLLLRVSVPDRSDYKAETGCGGGNSMVKKTSKSSTLPIYIINGPNLNLLGTREPEIYGRATLGEIEKLCAERSRSHGLSTVFLQSNKEGELVEFLQEARTGSSAVILNAAAYTHTSVAILDALQTLKQP